MFRKMMLLALARVGATMLTLPAPTSAAPIVEPGGTSFTATFGTFSLEAKEEPTITCEGPSHLTGSFNGSIGVPATGGTITFHYTNCHFADPIFGITIPCHTAGAPMNNTMVIGSLAFDLVYTSAPKSPGVLITNFSLTVECSGLASIKYPGSVLGTVTSPICGETKTSATMAFKATGSVQEHKRIEGGGTEFELKTETGSSGVKKALGINVTAISTFVEGKSATLTCP
jgi:hypothetical protein